MDKRTIERTLRDEGFMPHRACKHGMLWTRKTPSETQVVLVDRRGSTETPREFAIFRGRLRRLGITL